MTSCNTYTPLTENKKAGVSDMPAVIAAATNATVQHMKRNILHPAMESLPTLNKLAELMLREPIVSHDAVKVKSAPKSNAKNHTTSTGPFQFLLKNSLKCGIPVESKSPALRAET